MHYIKLNIHFFMFVFRIKYFCFLYCRRSMGGLRRPSERPSKDGLHSVPGPRRRHDVGHRSGNEPPVIISGKKQVILIPPKKDRKKT